MDPKTNLQTAEEMTCQSSFTLHMHRSMIMILILHTTFEQCDDISKQPKDPPPQNLQLDHFAK